MSNDEQEIRNLIRTWLAASEAGDNEKVLGLMADDAVFLVAGQPPMRGKAAFAAAQSDLANVDLDATSEVQEVTVLGEWAWVWTTLTVVITPKSGGKPVTRSGNTLSVLKKQNGVWLMYRDANMLAVVP